MKKILLSVVLMLAMTLGLLAQPTVTVGTVTGGSGIVNVPVTISGCDESNGGTPLTVIEFSISYNNVVNYLGITNISTLINDWIYSGNNSSVSANWLTTDPNFAAISIPDGTVLFEIQFTPNVGGTCPLIFSESSNVADGSFEPVVSAVFTDGSVTVGSAAATSVWNSASPANWSTVANWSNGIPGANTNATIATGTVLVNIPAVANSLVVEPNAALTVNSLITLTLSGLTLNSAADNQATGSYINNGGFLTVNGTTQVKRWLSGGEHHFISNPLRNTLELSSILAPGNPGWIYRYNEPTSVWVNMWDLLEDINVSYGYCLNYTNNQMLSFNSTNPDAFNPNATVPPTVTLTGTPGIATGWNLVGNPFPSALNWLGTGWTKTNIDNAVYYYNGTGYSQYVNGVGTPVGTTQYIPAGQGYFVHANAASPRLTMPKVSAVHNNQQYYKGTMQVENILRLALTGNGYNDETVIRFHNEASSSFDSDFDAYKLMSLNSEVGQIFSKGNAEYSINSLPQVTSGVEVPVSIMVGVAGEYTIQAAELNSFGENVAIYLEDKELNRVVNLKETPVYTFMASPGTDDRFKVLFNTATGIEDPQAEGFVYASGKTIFIGNMDGAVEIYNLSGQLIISGEISGSSLNSMNLPDVAEGIFIVKIINGNKVTARKVLVK